MSKSAVAETPVADHAPQRQGLRLLLWRWRYVLGGAIGVMVATGLYFYVSTPPAITPEFLFQRALREIDEGKPTEAVDTITPLQDQGYLDPEFPGGVEFIRGWTSLAEAEGLDETSRPAAYLAAVAFLREAERLTVPDARKPQWAYALGICLFRTGSISESVPHLREAVGHYPAGKIEACLALVDADLQSHEPEEFRESLQLSETTVKSTKLSPAQKDRAWLLRAAVLIRAAKLTDAESALQKLAQPGSNPGRKVLHAQILLAQDPTQALASLKPVAEADEGDQTFPAQANYLQGLCAQRLATIAQQRLRTEATEELRKEHRGWLENAVTYYERTAERFDKFPESIAARLAAADCLRDLGRTEEALDAYGRVLRQIPKPEEFRNRWIGVKRVREQVLAAWDEWLNQAEFASATALAELMPPVIAREEADDLVARSHEQWVAHTEREFAGLPLARRQSRHAEIRDRWRQAARAWARAAESRTKDSADALARSAGYYLKGEEFERAVVQLTQIIDRKPPPPHLVTTALLQRGQAHLDLDLTEQAIADFQRLIADYPTDANAFAAQYRLGHAHLERSELDQADAAWRKLLASDAIGPQSEEWRLSLFESTKLAFHRAEEEFRQTQMTRLTPESGLRREKAAERIVDVVRRTEEYLDRYPLSDHAAEARAIAARGLRRLAERYEEKQLAAETDNARSEFLKQRNALLERAVDHLQQLQLRLLERKLPDLDSISQSLLREASFELGHCRYALGDNQPAIDAYQACVGRYQQDPETLVALVQMANCYKRMKQPNRVASTLVQARMALKQLPDTAFPGQPGTMSRDDWSRWLDWAIGTQE